MFNITLVDLASKVIFGPRFRCVRLGSQGQFSKSVSNVRRACDHWTTRQAYKPLRYRSSQSVIVRVLLWEKEVSDAQEDHCATTALSYIQGFVLGKEVPERTRGRLCYRSSELYLGFYFGEKRGVRTHRRTIAPPKLSVTQMIFMKKRCRNAQVDDFTTAALSYTQIFSEKRYRKAQDDDYACSSQLYTGLFLL